MRARRPGAYRQPCEEDPVMLELGLNGKVAIITGGSEGLGRAAAEKLAAEGARVAICARRKEILDQAADEIRKATGGQVLAQVADVSRAADCEKVTDEAWQSDWELKVMGAVRMSRLVIPHMKKRGGGRIVNITTVGGKTPPARSLPTTVTRAAGLNLTKSLANEYAADNIRVNTVCIGLVRSAQIARRAKGDLEAHYAELAKLRVPLGRVAHAAEFADLFAFLVSERATYITGASINFDGGSGMTV